MKKVLPYLAMLMAAIAIYAVFGAVIMPAVFGPDFNRATTVTKVETLNLYGVGEKKAWLVRTADCDFIIWDPPVELDVLIKDMASGENVYIKANRGILNSMPYHKISELTRFQAGKTYRVK